MMAVVKTSDHFCMKQQINKRDTDEYTVCTYHGEALNHNIQLRIFCFKYIRGSSVGSIGSMGSANHWICHRDSFLEFICY